MTSGIIAPRWLPPGKRAAVVFSIDDIHPGTSSDAYEAGGDLAAGALGLVERLLEAHPDLHVTLFTTPDWREISPKVTRRLLAKVPVLRDRVYLAPVLEAGTMRIDRHPKFVAYLKSMPRTHVGLHGLHHVHPGHTILVEFQNQSVAACKTILRQSMALFETAGLPIVPGMTPPGWNAPPALLTAMSELGLRFIGSARDIRSPVTPDATAQMSGLRGVPLYAPAIVAPGLVHIPANFQATSPKERAFEIIESGGLLAVKAHIIKNALGHVALDGIDALYCNYLDVLFTVLEARYGDSLWWPSLAELADSVLAHELGHRRVAGA